jgi:hypothetical protein
MTWHAKTENLIAMAVEILVEHYPMTSRQVFYQIVSSQGSRPRRVSVWSDVAKFTDCVVPQNRRDVWPTQPCYLECWLEKDALSGIFEDVLDAYAASLSLSTAIYRSNSIPSGRCSPATDHHLCRDTAGPLCLPSLSSSCRRKSKKSACANWLRELHHEPGVA